MYLTVCANTCLPGVSGYVYVFSFLLRKEMKTIPGYTWYSLYLGRPHFILYAHGSLVYGEGGKGEGREGGEKSGWGRDSYVSLLAFIN